MIQSLESLHRAAQERGSRVLAVAAAQDAEVLLAVDAAGSWELPQLSWWATRNKFVPSPKLMTFPWSPTGFSQSPIKSRHAAPP